MHDFKQSILDLEYLLTEETIPPEQIKPAFKKIVSALKDLDKRMGWIENKLKNRA